MSRIPSIIQGLPDDLMTNDVTYLRRQKVSSESSSVAAAYNEKLYTIPAKYNIAAGNSIALNISPASEMVITKVVTNSEFSISIYSEHATGSADGIFAPVNMNLCSIDESPTTSQVYYAATAQGSRLDYGHGTLNTSIIACENTKPCVVITNDTLEADLIEIQVQFEEIGPRNPLFGLTASTELEPTTEMSAYG